VRRDVEVSIKQRPAGAGNGLHQNTKRVRCRRNGTRALTLMSSLGVNFGSIDRKTAAKGERAAEKHEVLIRM
jgi:hypothetical protein